MLPLLWWCQQFLTIFVWIQSFIDDSKSDDILILSFFIFHIVVYHTYVYHTRSIYKEKSFVKAPPYLGCFRDSVWSQCPNGLLVIVSTNSLLHLFISVKQFPSSFHLSSHCLVPFLPEPSSPCLGFIFTTFLSHQRWLWGPEVSRRLNTPKRNLYSVCLLVVQEQWGSQWPLPCATWLTDSTPVLIRVSWNPWDLEGKIHCLNLWLIFTFFCFLFSKI